MRRRHSFVRSALLGRGACSALISLVVSGVVTAAYGQPRPSSYEVIVLGGGRVPAEAEQVLRRFEDKVFYLRYAGDAPRSYPRVLRSDDIPGLKPGFHIAVAGMCNVNEHDVASRERLLQALRTFEKGTYTRTVVGQYGDPCPPLSAFLPPGAEERRLRAQIEAQPNSTTALYAYAAYLAAPDNLRLFEADAFVNKVLRLDPKHEQAKQLAEKIMVLQTD